MCANMKEFQTVSEKLYELEQRKAKKKKRNGRSRKRDQAVKK